MTISHDDYRPVTLAFLKFIEDYRIMRGGAFRYSREKGTRAFGLGDPVPSVVKAQRVNRISEAIAENIRYRNAGLVGNKAPTIYDYERAPGEWLGRTYADAPDIDFDIMVRDPAGRPGRIAEVVVTGCDGLALRGCLSGE